MPERFKYTNSVRAIGAVIYCSAFILTVSLSLASGARQPEKPLPPAKITIKEALSEDLHGETVDITGVVLRQMGAETILVHDGTAAIEVDVPPDQIPQSGLKPNTRIRIKGEITHENNGSHEVEANQIFWTF